jgi:predicted adenine nucleotide alpha hydrolase (AANH) superfamily ATPase
MLGLYRQNYCGCLYSMHGEIHAYKNTE